MKVISSDVQLKETCAIVRESMKSPLYNETKPFITLDTEFLRDTTYWPVLGLIQLGTLEDAFLIDPLHIHNWDPFVAILFDASITKVLHGCDQDLGIFRKMFGRIPDNVFDTQVSLLALGPYENLAYDKMVMEFCGVQLDKSNRYTDWLKRPLTQLQCEYALYDVTYLAQIYRMICKKLSSLNRTDWLKDELKLLNDNERYSYNPKDAWMQFRMPRNADKKFIAVVRALCEWRDDRAQMLNRPRNMILKDAMLNDLAKTQPDTMEKFRQNRLLQSLHPDIAEKIVDIISHTLYSKLDEQSHVEVLPECNKDLFDVLLMLTRMKCKEHSLAERLLAPSDSLKRLALGLPNQITEGWRNDVLGVDAVKVMSGKLVIGFIDGKLRLLPI